MRLGSLMLKGMARRRWGVCLGVLSALVATATYVSVETLTGTAEEALRRAMLRLGHNLLIVPAGAPHDRLWTARFGQFSMSEDLLDRLASQPNLPVDYYQARLQKRVRLTGGVLGILTGVRSVSTARDLREVEPLLLRFGGPFEVALGADLADILGKDRGDTIDLLGHTFTVGRVLRAHGSRDDIRIYAPLRTVQKLLSQPGRIDSIACLARFLPDEPRAAKRVKEQLEGVLRGGAEVILERRAFEVRHRSRRMLHTVGATVALVLLVLCGTGLAVYVYHNLSQRRYETALLVALGYTPGRVAGVLVGEVGLMGLVAGLSGWLVGTALAVAAGPTLVAVERVRPMWGLWWRALVFAALLCAASAAVAVRETLRLAPADLLRNR